MLLTRAQPYQQGHTATRVHACNLSRGCMYVYVHTYGVLLHALN